MANGATGNSLKVVEIDIPKIASSRLYLSLMFVALMGLGLVEELLSIPRFAYLSIYAFLSFCTVVMVKRVAEGLGRSTAKQWLWVALTMLPLLGLAALLTLLLISERAIARSPYRVKFFSGKLVKRDA
jgi:L-asparagine transporter-like permease